MKILIVNTHQLIIEVNQVLPRTVVRVEFSSIVDLTVKKKIDILLNILSDEYDQNLHSI